MTRMGMRWWALLRGIEAMCLNVATRWAVLACITCTHGAQLAVPLVSMHKVMPGWLGAACTPEALDES